MSHDENHYPDRSEGQTVRWQGKEVKQTQVTEQGDKTQVKETTTKVKSDGTLEKRETTVEGDDIK